VTALGDQLDALLALAETAAAACSPKYDDVAIGAPVPRGRCVRLWWSGEAIPAPQMGGSRYTLNSELVGAGVVVTVFEPFSDLGEEVTANAMVNMATFIDGLRSGIDADRTLGGKTIAVEPEATPAEYAQLGQVVYGFASMAMQTGMTEYLIGG